MILMKQTGEKGVSGIQVEHRMKTIRSNTGFIYLQAFLLAILVYSCGPSKKMADDDEVVQGQFKMNESQLSEYNYALTEATKQKVFGNIQQAAALYHKCIDVNPLSDVAYYQLGGLYIRARDIASAKKFSQKAVDLNGDNYWYYMQLVSLYQYEGNRDSTIAIYEVMTEKWPGKVNIQYELARNYAEVQKYDESLILLNRIERENGISEQVSMLKEQIYAGTNRMEKAADEMIKLVEASPDDVRYLGLLAELYGEMQKDEEALELYGKIFQIEPENGLAQLSIAEFYKEKGETEKRIEYLKMAFRNESLAMDKKLEVMISLLMSDTEVESLSQDIEELIGVLIELYPDEYRAHAAFGDFLVKKERYKEAIKEFETVIEHDKDNYFIWEQLIFLYNAEGNQERVYSLCSEAIDRYPERSVLYLFKGNIEAGREEYEKGIQTLKTGVKYSGNNKGLLLQLYSFIAEAYRNTGNDTQSDSYFEKALELDPENLLLLNNYSYYLALREEKLEEAEVMSRTTITAEPDNATYLDTYAWILYKQGKNKKALEYMHIALQNGGAEDPDILEHYGDILYKMGKGEDAVRYWKKAIEYGASEEAINAKIRK